MSVPPSTCTHWYSKVTPFTPSGSRIEEVLAVTVCVTRSGSVPAMVGLLAALLSTGTTRSEARLVCSSALERLSVNDTFTLSVLPTSAWTGVYVALVAPEMFAPVPPLDTRIHW